MIFDRMVHAGDHADAEHSFFFRQRWRNLGKCLGRNIVRNNCEFLFRQLEVIRPKAICALGSTAAKALLATKDGVMRLRGNWHKWRGIPLIVTYHPSYLLRPYNQNAKREAWEDLKEVLHFVYD